jgi:protein TonB
MDLKKPFMISMIIHICFFAAAMLFSAGITGGSGKWSDEKTFFVHLEEDVPASKGEQSAVEKKTPPVKKLQQAQKEKSRPQIQKDIVPLETIVVDSDPVVFDEPEDVASDVVVAHYEAGDDAVVDIAYSQDISINPAHSDFLSGENSPLEDNYGGMGSQGIIAKIRKSIERVKIYPVLARKRGIEGTVHIGFRITPQGEPRGIKIIKGSGFRILDQATMDIVKRAAPFPHINAPVEVPVVFTLN